MKVEVNKVELLSALTNVQKVLNTRASIEILRNTLLVAENGVLKLVASDVDVTIVQEIEATVHESGKGLLPKLALTKTIKLIEAPVIVLESDGDDIKIIGNDTTIQYNNESAGEDYPRLPHAKFTKLFTVEKEIFDKRIVPIMLSVSKQESRPILQGVNFEMNEGSVKVVSTDSHRLAKSVFSTDLSKKLNVKNRVFSSSMIDLVNKTKPTSNSYEFLMSEDSRMNLIKMDNGVAVYAREIEGIYPETDRLIPSNSDIIIKVQSPDFKKSLEKLQNFVKSAKNEVVKLVIYPKLSRVSLSHDSEIGKMTINVKGEFSEVDSELEVSFNPSYALDAIKQVDSKELTLKLSSPVRPFIVEGEKGNVTALLTPIRTY